MTLTADTEEKYSLVQQTDGLWMLTKDENGTKVNKGQLQFVFTVKPENPTYPESFEARAVSAGSDTLTLMTQDTAVTDYSNAMQFTYAADALVYTGRDGDTDEQMKLDRPGNINYGDYLKIKLNEQGQIQEVRAYSGSVSGTITEVKEASVQGTLSNPFVTVRCTDGVTRTFEIGRECQLKFAGAVGENILMVPVGKIGLSVGQTVTVEYCPYTVNGRTRALQIR